MEKQEISEKPAPKLKHDDFSEVEKRFPFLIWFIMISGLLLVILGFYNFFRTTAYVPGKEPYTDIMIEPDLEKVTVQLYYYNQEVDREIAEYYPGSPDAILPVERKIPKSENIIADTIHLLLRGELTEEENEAGFTTEFPGPNFRLLRAEKENGRLTLVFEDTNSFTVGGSMRTGIFAMQIQKTALQFPEVQEVVFEPETLFQP